MHELNIVSHEHRDDGDDEDEEGGDDGRGGAIARVGANVIGIDLMEHEKNL